MAGQRLVGGTATRRRARPLSEAETEAVRSILDGPALSYVDHPLFEGPDAERALFDEADALPQARADWYHPGLDTAIDARRRPPAACAPLTPSQERTAFLQYNFARRQEARLQEQGLRARLSTQAARSLLHWHREALRLRDQIVQFNLGLVLAMARRVSPPNRDYTELISEASIDLVRAVEKFDVGRNYKFSTYACHTIRHACGRALTRESKHHARFPVSFDPEMERPAPEPVEDDVTIVQALRDVLDSNAAGLNDVERQILKRRFPLDGDRPARRPTLTDVGALIGYSKERTRQMQKQALAKLRLAMEQHLAGVA